MNRIFNTAVLGPRKDRGHDPWTMNPESSPPDGAIAMGASAIAEIEELLLAVASLGGDSGQALRAIGWRLLRELYLANPRSARVAQLIESFVNALDVARREAQP